MGSNAAVNSSSFADGVYVSFLHLPLEIRQQIYLEVLAVNPRIDRAPLGYLVRRVSPYVTSLIIPQKQSQTSTGCGFGQLSSSRGIGYIPRNLLQTCKQIYYEARRIPFQTNEFVFDDWMTSALTYCATLLRIMQHWQRETIKYVRLQMDIQSLLFHSATTPSWLDVWGMLPAVQGMRMKLACNSSTTTWFKRGDKDGTFTVIDDWGSGSNWIVDGLRKMTALKQLEIELAFKPATSSAPADRDALTLRWCAKVEAILNEGRSEETRTRVVAVAQCCPEPMTEPTFAPLAISSTLPAPAIDSSSST